MGYPKLSRDAALAVGVEGTAGSAETLAWNTHAIRLASVSQPEPFYLAPNGRRDFITGGLGRLAAAEPKGLCCRLPFNVAIQGAGSAYAYVSEASKTTPAIHALLRGGGFSLGVSGAGGSEVASYSLADDPSTCITAYYEYANKKWIIYGAVVEGMQISTTAGGLAFLSGSIVGRLTAPTEQALEAATYSTARCMTWNGSASVSLAAYALKANTMTVDFGTTAEPNVSANAADGLEFFKITGRTPIITLAARVPAVSDWNVFSQWGAPQTGLAFDATVGVDQGQYLRMKLNADNATVEDVKATESGSFCDYTVQLLAGTHATAELDVDFD